MAINPRGKGRVPEPEDEGPSHDDAFDDEVEREPIVHDISVEPEPDPDTIVHDITVEPEVEPEPEPVVDEVLDGPAEAEPLSDEDAALLDVAATDLVAEMRSDMLRAQAELVNFRNRVERDRAANRDAVIADVIRSLLPALDDLSRAEKHGDLEGSPLEIVATKLRSSLERYGLRSVGEVGEPFDPHLHEAVVQLPSADVTVETVADVIDPGYALGERLIRAAKVAVSTPES